MQRKNKHSRRRTLDLYLSLQPRIRFSTEIAMMEPCSLLSTEKAMKGLELNGSDANPTPKRWKSNYGDSCKWYCVEGYDTSLQVNYLELVLRKHFSSCGYIVNVSVTRDSKKGILERYALIKIVDEEDKALQLSGSDMGGWTAYVTLLPEDEELVYDSDYYEEHLDEDFKYEEIDEDAPISDDRLMFVKGYDTSLPQIDIRIGLCNYFSSCGEVLEVWPFSDGTAQVCLKGDEAIEKAQKLSGSIVGGWKIDVCKILPPVTRKSLGNTSYCCCSLMRGDIEKLPTE